MKATRVDDDADDADDDDDDDDAQIDYDDDPMDWEETSDDEDGANASDNSLSSSDEEQNLDDGSATTGGGGARNLSVALSGNGNKKRCSRFGLECRGGAASHRFAVSLANVELSKIVKEDPPVLDEVCVHFLTVYSLPVSLLALAASVGNWHIACFCDPLRWSLIPERCCCSFCMDIYLVAVCLVGRYDTTGHVVGSWTQSQWHPDWEWPCS